MNSLIKVFYICVGGIALLFILYGIWSAMATAQLQKRLNALQQEGMPITLADLKKDAPPPDKNAAVWLRRGREDLDAIGKEIFNNVDMNKPLSAEDIQKMQAALAAYHTGLQYVHQAANCTVYNAEPDYTAAAPVFIEQQLNRIQLFRSATRALQCESMVQLSTGDTEGSLQTALDMIELSKHLKDEPSLVAYLTRIAVVGMALSRVHDVLATPLEPADHERIEQALVSLDSDAGFKWAIETERAFAIDSVNSLHQQSGALGLSPIMKQQVCSVIDLFSSAHSLTHLSYVDAEKQLNQGPTGGTLAQLTAPALRAAFVAHARIIAEIRTLRILNAIQVQNVTHVKDLKIDDAVWIDPVDGKRLKVLQSDGMWTIYSIGRNLRDDGGDIDHQKDADTGWKMPVAAQN